MTVDSETATALTAARWTPFGRGAIGTVRVQGDLARLTNADLFRAANGRPLAGQRLGRIVFGRWGTDAPEDIVVCRVSESITELHCHGGEAAVSRILNDLERAGAAVETWDRQARHERGLIAGECQQTLAAAKTVRTAAILARQSNGLLEGALRQLAPGGDLSNGELLHRLDGLLAWADFGRHLTEPWRIVLTGRPNAGKSSLINRLLGYTRSIVYDEPGTTRDVVTGETAFGGWPVQLLDTAGLRTTGDELEASGVERARLHAARADLPVIVLDMSQPPDPADLELLASFPEGLVVAHKSDLPRRWTGPLPEAAIEVSSLTGDGLPTLMSLIERRLVPAVPPFDQPLPVSPRQIDVLSVMRELLKAGEAESYRAAYAVLIDGV